MSSTLHELFKRRDYPRENPGRDATIAPAESERRAQIADLIANISAREGWKLKHCAAVSQSVEQAPIASLDAIHAFLHARREGLTHGEALAFLANLVENATATVYATGSKASTSSTVPLGQLYDRMQELESRVAGKPGSSYGVQGIRLMHVVALMSKARSAKLARVRIEGTQAIYRHA
ncbi:hypothetical protein AWB71_03664 [Caballeronia peredens]|nr:hypothetical protein AWB71_03664 [Caballeronia peredens]